jgi:hypothetical protein
MRLPILRKNSARHQSVYLKLDWEFFRRQFFNDLISYRFDDATHYGVIELGISFLIKPNVSDSWIEFDLHSKTVTVRDVHHLMPLILLRGYHCRRRSE